VKTNWPQRSEVDMVQAVVDMVVKAMTYRIGYEGYWRTDSMEDCNGRTRGEEAALVLLSEVGRAAYI
jgi:hypothetical protein